MSATGRIPRTTMWEVRATAGALERLEHWVRTEALPALAEGDEVSGEVYAAADERLVVIATGARSAPRFPEPPASLQARPPHQWLFTRLAAGGGGQEHRAG